MLHKVDIPETYLLIIAVHGKMGDGELPDFMRMWAQKECRNLGISEKVSKLQNEKMIELKNRLSKVIGSENVNKIEVECKKAGKYLKNTS
ncbi:hypothetical protein LCGC14_0351990 [marine sediment metagenome]|uniref:Uncharacterized protein n=1 Tax=marine sediment metagenome TaxID=412755 RepID=A0A0F9TAV1_9ZZZZ